MGPLLKEEVAFKDMPSFFPAAGLEDEFWTVAPVRVKALARSQAQGCLRFGDQHHFLRASAPGRPRIPVGSMPA